MFEDDDDSEYATLASAIRSVASQLKWLGTGDASTPFGAIEALCVEVDEAGQRIADGLSGVAEAIRYLADTYAQGLER
jgi:hypothetical protein